MESLTESGLEPMKSPVMAVVLERLQAIGNTRYFTYAFHEGKELSTNMNILEADAPIIV